MGDNNYNVKVTVDVAGKKVMDELAKGAGGGGSKDSSKSLAGGLGQATGSIMKDGDIGTTFQTLIKSVTGLSVILGVGVGILLMAVANSKIIGTIFGTIGKLLGFLMDIILLPMMPIFMMLVRLLYQMILAFKSFTKNLDLASILKFGIGILMLTSPLGWLIKLIQWAVGEGNIRSAVNFTVGILQGIGGWLWSIASWLWGAGGKLVNSAISIGLNIGSSILGFLGGIADLGISLLKFMFGLASPQNTTLTLNFVANLVGTAWNVLKSIANTGTSFINAGLKSVGLQTLDSGGTVMSTGIAVVHRGETFSGVTGGGQPVTSTGGGNTYIFQNYGQTKTELELFDRFMNLMRQRGQGLKL